MALAIFCDPVVGDKQPLKLQKFRDALWAFTVLKILPDHQDLGSDSSDWKNRLVGSGMLKG